MGKIICPKCGQEGYVATVIVKNRKYLYVMHKEDKKLVKHYIGPAGGYVAVNKIYGLNLTNLLDAKLEDAISSLLDRLEEEIEKGKDREKKLKQIWDLENLLELHMKRLKDYEAELVVPHEQKERAH